MKRKNITLSESCIEKLNAMSKETGLSASELIRNSVDVYWKQIMPVKVTVHTVSAKEAKNVRVLVKTVSDKGREKIYQVKARRTSGQSHS